MSGAAAGTDASPLTIEAVAGPVIDSEVPDDVCCRRTSRNLRRPFTAIDHPRVFSARSASVSHLSAISMKRDLWSDVRAASAKRMQSAALLRNWPKMSKCTSMSLDMGTALPLCPANSWRDPCWQPVGGLQVYPGDLFSARHCGSGLARHVTRCTQACGLPCKLPKKLSCQKNGQKKRRRNEVSAPLLLAASMRYGSSGVTLDCLKTARTYYA